MNIRPILHNSDEWKQTIGLRDRVLRKPLGLAFSQADLDAEANHIHLAAFEDEALIACLVLVPQDERIKMRQVAVEPENQGQGYGRKLVHFAEEMAKNDGHSLIYCNARDVAVPFYLQLGYVQVGQEFVEVGIPHVQMEKRLISN